MFIVEPYTRNSGIRSPLGFLSLATNWARRLFPGITVLTRDFLHVELLHQEMRRLSRKGFSQWKVKEVLKSRQTHRRLEMEANRIKKENDPSMTKMTYWQRYGSLFKYFRLQDAPRILRAKDVSKIVFQRGIPGEHQGWLKEDLESRRRRINHLRWFETFYPLIERPSPDGKISGNVRWWITGIGTPKYVSDDIRLSRQIEFAFVVWQTYFEICCILLLSKKSPPTSPGPISGLPAVTGSLIGLANGIASGESPDLSRLESLAKSLLALHVSFLGKSIPRWQKEVQRRYGDSKLYLLYDGIPAASLAVLPPQKLLSRLVSLHESYCQAQGKRHALYVKKTAGNKFEPVSWPDPWITVQFTSGRWGLFGYRLNEAVVFATSLD